MKTYAKFRPPSPARKASKDPPALGIFEKSIFCQRSQATSDQKTTDSFPEFLRLLTTLSRVPALDPGISQHQRTDKLPWMHSRPPGQNTKSKNAKRTEPGPQENSEVGTRRRTQSPHQFLSAIIRCQKARIPQPGSPTRRSMPQTPRQAIYRPGSTHGHEPIDPVHPARDPRLCARHFSNTVAQSRRDPRIQQRKQYLHPQAGISRYQIRAPHTHLSRAAGPLLVEPAPGKMTS
jgi:hypothetical protein